MATEIITSFDQQCDASGNPMSGALVYVYDVGTTTKKTVYSDTALSVSVANPIVCDSAGRHDMRYIATGSYKIVIKTSADVTVYTRDNIDGRVPVGSGALAIANGGTGATTAGAALTALGAATAAEVAAVAADVAALAGAASSTDKTHIATGTTAQRPASPANGDIRRNTTIPQWEGYNGTGWKFLVSEDELATQAQMETATSLITAVSPGRVQYNPGVAKIWAKISGAAATIEASHNVASAARSGVGTYSVTISQDMSSAEYCAVGSAFHTGHANVTITNIIAGQIFFICTDAAGAAVDPTSVFIVAYGDQA